MDDYGRMIAALKMAGENLGYLHRNITGRGFLAAHEKIGEWYEEAAAQLDALTETGLSLGIAEPTIQESVMTIPPDIPTGVISVRDGLIICGKIARGVKDAMEKARAIVPDDVKSELDGSVHKWRIAADYFVRRAAEEERRVDDDE